MPAMQRRWGPDYVIRWLFNQDDIWITAKGEAKVIDQMDPDHALNTLLFLERVADDLPFDREHLQDFALYKALRKRVLDILVPPLFEAGPAGPQWEGATRNFQPIPGAPWAVYKLTDDGKVEWDAPWSQADAKELAEQRNRDEGR